VQIAVESQRDASKRRRTEPQSNVEGIHGAQSSGTGSRTEGASGTIAEETHSIFYIKKVRVTRA
jgi:hypothetical protein